MTICGATGGPCHAVASRAGAHLSMGTWAKVSAVASGTAVGLAASATTTFVHRDSMSPSKRAQPGERLKQIQAGPQA